ncbi:hypothetical protein P8452_28593 [Trifolium repens]|nr:hypothetical protein P8452_28593 [Trifolium repens]
MVKRTFNFLREIVISGELAELIEEIIIFSEFQINKVVNSYSEVLIQMSNSADETMVQPTAKRPKLSETENADRPHQKISGSSLSYVKHVDIDAEISSMDTEIPPKFLLSWLLELVNTKSLTVTASTLQVLSLNSNLLKIKLPSLVNLNISSERSTYEIWQDDNVVQQNLMDEYITK